MGRGRGDGGMGAQAPAFPTKSAMFSRAELAAPGAVRPAHLEPLYEQLGCEVGELGGSCHRAVHEAGHAMTAWCCSGVTDIDAVILDGSGGGGQVDYWLEEIDGDGARWCRLVIVLGGVAAEVFVFGRAKVASAATDLLRARDLAGQIARARVAAPWAPSAARDGAAMPFKDLYKPPLKKVELEIIDQGYRMARSILVRREESYQRLVARLTGYRTLDAGDLLAMLGDRRDIFGAAGSRATFVTG